ncbi:exopolyphosphatase / guanosine-5'-triphosphate,3'-diphosphate pyrophosphatase [Paenimyroides ummariense]|uniref:Exopolyphosphatase / guanosine-5'-triphosphate,3'-diphosphate pyrophosphatase n=1 Tax=Paenimyroides ummariense TaxID=913024 RepID=A0A1I4XS05_9FLAO|nr:exopolyphosphatase [Paenimyroides ummariense]SFN28456.1 exopolyphosphatase / guanosine-5'-triphosphate,3'-diphosphate pyrophosphatase [Paenimyroides ummariense]
MIKIKKYAAIDIGSNAMRLLIANVIEEENKPTQFNKSHLIRVPIRLGQDAFTVGEISEESAERMVKAMKAFKLLMDVYKVEQYAACATSAMREAYNGKELVDEIAKKAKINIDIIEGKTEAAIIANSDLESYIKNDGHYLYVDVGGGSTEFTLFSNGKQIVSKSFKNGTVRLLNNMVTESVWQEIEKWIKTHTENLSNVEIIGSGGNINKIFKMSGKTNDKPLTQSYLVQRFKYLNSLSYEERIYTLGLNTDRADVIIPAIKIYVNAMKWSNAKHIYVPKIGLSDGIVKAMYNQNTKITINEIL